jgi:hypothetical protein
LLLGKHLQILDILPEAISESGNSNGIVSLNSAF